MDRQMPKFSESSTLTKYIYMYIYVYFGPSLGMVDQLTHDL